MKKLIITLMFFGMLLMNIQVLAQRATNKIALQEFSQKKAIEFEVKKAEALEYAKQNNIPLIIETDETFMELMFLDGFDKPQYFITDNVNAAATISTNRVHPTGNNGFTLNGFGMTVHEWDARGVRLSHQEFSGRALQVDNPTYLHYHSTHVAGTLIAAGYDWRAKGMAPAASLRAFDWNSDEAEMADEAANENALVSNHSYGVARGWHYIENWSWHGTPSISEEEDYKFGFYDHIAEDWDQIAYDAPYYLIVKSAGNDRNEGPWNGDYPQDGPYDCIAHSGLSKNVLTVGAVEDIPNGYTQPSDVVMTDFSSWGPVDDGRIKPDIVANGYGLYSTDASHNTDYTSLSGTSMSSPSVAGSAILLQQHFENLNGTGNFMQSATLKALIIHTADEAGDHAGPDYSFGWGLMNTMKAVQKIKEDSIYNVIDELSLDDGDNHQITVTAEGGQPLQVTICWTEEPGTPVAASLDPSDAMLVNDLDLRITESTNTYFPWKLDKDNPEDAATRNSENNVDNVEMVTIDNPVANTDYTIVIDHDGSLSGGSQDFSIIISGVNPPITDFKANIRTLYVGVPVQFADLTFNGPTTWAWSFSPSTVTFLNGTDANSQNPQVEFDAGGIFDVSLTTTNALGTDTETKTAFITVEAIPPVNLPWIEGFEEVGGVRYFTVDTNFIYGLPEWAYDKTNKGRLRFDAGSGFYHSGNRAATLDNYTYGLSINHIIATLDLTDYSSSTDLELSFFYMHHGESAHNNDYVWIRGSENDTWLYLYSLYYNQGDAGEWNFVEALDVDELLSSNGQTPTSTFQIRFGQEGNAFATSTTQQDGYTFDDIVLSGTTPLPPLADFMADGTMVVEGTAVQFTDLSTRKPTSWSWTFEGGTPANSTEQNPLVTYNSEGTYEVSLTATNIYGSDTETKTDYITVNSSGTYCIVNGSEYEGQWISEVGVNGFTKTSGGAGYSDFTSDIVSLNETANSFTLTPSFIGDPQRVYFRIWIDWNADGDFDDEDELVYSSPRTKVAISGSFDKPSGYSGETRMRIGMQRSSNAVPYPCTDIVQGEFEDYTVAYGGGGGSAYCQVTGSDFDQQWISEVEMNSFIKTSVGDGYSDFTSDIVSLNETANSFTLTPSFSGSPQRVYFRIWIDWNADGDFDDEDELVYSSPRTKVAISGSFDKPSGYSGETRMRIGMQRSSNAVPYPCTDIVQGEFEDYTVNFGGGGGPDYCQVTGSDYDQQWISEVEMNSLIKPSLGDGYSDFTSDIVSLNETANSFTLTPSFIGDPQRVYFRIWIDWNADGDFDDADELVYSSPRTKVAISGSFDKPSDYSGETRMRIGMQRSSNAVPYPCTDIIQGEFEDYTVNYTEGANPPIADFIADITTLTEGGSVNFSDLSTNTPTSWAWAFEGGTPSSSSVQNPTITYSTAGTYDVTLMATNAEGSGTETKTNYITVNPTSSEVELSYSDFEGGWGTWTSGGDDCMLYTDGTYSYGGVASVDIQDNSDVASSFYMTNGEDVHTPGYIQIDVEFSFLAISMDGSDEDFWVQYFDGTDWNTVADFDEGIDFDNDVFYSVTVSILEAEYTFPTEMKIRFMCDASGDRDDVYIDEIRIIASTQIISGGSNVPVEDASKRGLIINGDEIVIHPNPAYDKLYISIDEPEDLEVMIYSISGKMVQKLVLPAGSEEVDISHLEEGLYLIKIKAADEIFTKKIIKK